MQVGDYTIKPSSQAGERALIEFLEFNGFTHDARLENNPSDNEYVIIANAVNRTYHNVDRFFVFSEEQISEIEFLNRVNYYPERNIIHEKIFNDDVLAYEGYTLCGKPYGLGVVYYPNGNRYREGVFDIKGIIEGKEFYSNGQVKFAGLWRKNTAYGPNFPILGNYYSEKGELIFSGKFEVIRGGVGYPMMKYPRYRLEEKDSPEIEYIKYLEICE